MSEDLIARCQRLEADARARASAAVTSAQADRAAKWARIQAQEPGLVALLDDLKRAGAKPRIVRMEFITEQGRERVI